MAKYGWIMYMQMAVAMASNADAISIKTPGKRGNKNVQVIHAAEYDKFTKGVSKDRQSVSIPLKAHSTTAEKALRNRNHFRFRLSHASQGEG